MICNLGAHPECPNCNCIEQKQTEYKNGRYGIYSCKTCDTLFSSSAKGSNIIKTGLSRKAVENKRIHDQVRSLM